MKAKGSPKVQAKKTKYMSDEAFADFRQALKDTLAFERGERRSLRITRIEGLRPPKAPIKMQRSDKD
jgi:hypothetical protein